MVTSSENQPKVSKIVLDAIEFAMFYTTAGTSTKMPYLLTFNSKDSLTNDVDVNGLVVIKNETPYKSRARNITTETYTCLHSGTKPTHIPFKSGTSVYSNVLQPVSKIFLIKYNFLNKIISF